MKVLKKLLIVSCLSLIIMGMVTVSEINNFVIGIVTQGIDKPIEPHHIERGD